MVIQETKHDFDVAILGNGLSGSMLSTILCKKGASVVLIDADQHPRFAVGESTIPHTSLIVSLLAEKYDLPELEHIVDTQRLAKHVCTTCGIKRHFGYVYHRPGQIYDRREGLQFGTSARDENHWFRQDIDAYLHNLAVHYGAVPRQKTKVISLEINKQGVKLRTSTGEEIRARYLVDGTGHRSILAERFGLRENPTRLKHHSRTLFTHMVDVPYQCRTNNRSTPLSEAGYVGRGGVQRVREPLPQRSGAIQGRESGSAVGIHWPFAIFLKADGWLSLLPDVACFRIYRSTFLTRDV